MNFASKNTLQLDTEQKFKCLQTCFKVCSRPNMRAGKQKERSFWSNLSNNKLVKGKFEK